MAANGSTAYEVFQNFTLSAAPYYKLQINQGKGSAGDSGNGLSFHQGYSFSTFDNDDAHSCSKKNHGAWWYHQCSHVNLNGRYVTPGTVSPGGFSRGEDGIIYDNFIFRESLKETKMMFRRVKTLKME
ncbi:hypothetical protein DPMN_177784 [Dreissena polymorpha]|uniref:Fibrinogen C-terminal domain-containing protein n=2 Tax=Dreissena polymorpha TaxID=45954 RepID=A0A9D4II39_DREPO|nr:hypothetical protein DPMN_177784 [Dreissena polymorpha]